MNMKGHILVALREEFNHWEELLISLDNEQVTHLQVLADWSAKDVLGHLWAWQQISIARLEAALADREPKFPKWVAELQADWENNVSQTNDQIYELCRTRPWSKIYPSWRKGFLKFLDLAAKVPERDLLDSSKYPWLDNYPLADILLASYDHHQEHLEKLIGWFKEYEEGKVIEEAAVP
jgi:hypothetical protein